MTEDEILTETPSDIPVTVETISTEDEGVTVNVTIDQTVPEAAPENVADDKTVVSEVVSDVRTFSVTSPDVLEAAQSNDVPAVMADVIVSVLGEYQRQTYTVQEVDSSGNVIATSTEYVPGLAGLDYHWITGAILFVMFIGGIFKLLGGLIRS